MTKTPTTTRTMPRTTLTPRPTGPETTLTIPVAPQSTTTTPVTPRHSHQSAGRNQSFRASFQQLTPGKDFSAIYMDVQSLATQLEREKFECMKAKYKDERATAAALNIRQAKASLVEKLVASGVVDPETIRELVSIAFEQD
ncbi:hypothetical protein DYB26_015623 [Aphanomyces astaci]|uniref:Uncharacterized protein n=1 Tax=Aphanomyces astaci TaxID=112090 RepID=A0A3R6Y9X0_APHAT|nr:hypothetical protein DYB26_015623 [Aphanomyces astaci]